MTVSNALCKFVEKQFNYPSEDWNYEHVHTTLQEVLGPQYLTDTMQGDKEVDTYTYYTMNNDQDHIYPFIISTMEETIALGGSVAKLEKTSNFLFYHFSVRLTS
ncbi:TPA: hypothetical protein PF714_002607 [Staphylococcus aureus]|uniref:SAUGI family uracil-DNA glycosylase inhibitor n=1 Tax=Staphylococcus aureus TaxID=1280 RepID=UPI00139AD538|nr:SAUGI family uracil-DNA glycosylase inhibitor [Staphylococcus aureus]NDP30633.1 hypothetical protein [Staphylococcus aureus]NDP32237.1 hypothetical protein [Staphylococcus aureus]NDP96227.1 hypothetical protein [Staphylococcus aureus]NDQ09292.1 hypothetical protein [Staphylococcus aureus]NDQ17928.1 hypothetical protein [Staphylococcus aureus]